MNTILPVGGEVSNWGTGEGISVAGVDGSVPCGVGEATLGVPVVTMETGVTVDKPPSPSDVCVADGCGLGGFCQI